MEKNIGIYVLLLFVSLICFSQDTVEVGDKKVKPVTKFNLIKLQMKSSEKLADLFDQSRCKRIFDSLIPRKGVEFYGSPSFIVKENEVIYRVRDNCESIGYFFENIDSKEKVRDLISWNDFNLGRIINSSKLYEKIVEEVVKIKPGWVIENTSPFDGFEVDILDNNYYLAKYLYSGLNDDGCLSIESIKCLVDHKGHITPVESKILIKGPEIEKGAVALPSDSEELLFHNALQKAIVLLGEYADPVHQETDKNKRLFYYIYYDTP